MTPLPPSPEVRVASVATLRRLVGRFRPVRGRALGVFLLLLLRAVLDVTPPFLLAVVIDRLVGAQEAGRGLPEGFVALVSVYGAVLLARQITFYASQVAATSLGQHLENTLRTELFDHVMHLRFTYHDENRSGKTIARSLRDMEKAKQFYREVWFGYVEIALLFAAVILAVFLVHVSYGFAVAGIFGAGAWICIRTARRIAWIDRGVSDHYDEVTTVLQENVAGAPVVRAFGRETHQVDRFGRSMDAYSAGWVGMERYWTGLMPIVTHLYSLCGPVVVLIAGWRIAHGVGSIGEVAAILLYVRTVQHRLRPLTRLVIEGQQAVASATRVFEVLDRPEVLLPRRGWRALPAEGGDLKLEDVHFAHAGTTAVLKGVTLHVPKGRSLGIIGVTGSGKSTLAQLVPRFYDPDRGTVEVDGFDVRDLDVHELRCSVGLVFQEPFLFSDTVARNIAYGDPSLGEAAIHQAAHLAAADAFVRDLPRGYQTVIGERGVSLSGGQRQRLTIARALAMDPRILIFDDATASVDAVTEKVLFEGIRRAARGRTTLVISQRVTSVRWCDEIAVLEDGVITARGPHDDLVERSPLYREIHEYQRLAGVTG